MYVSWLKSNYQARACGVCFGGSCNTSEVQNLSNLGSFRNGVWSFKAIRVTFPQKERLLKPFSICVLIHLASAYTFSSRLRQFESWPRQEPGSGSEEYQTKESLSDIPRSWSQRQSFIAMCQVLSKLIHSPQRPVSLFFSAAISFSFCSFCCCSLELKKRGGPAKWAEWKSSAIWTKALLLALQLA